MDKLSDLEGLSPQDKDTAIAGLAAVMKSQVILIPFLIFKVVQLRPLNVITVNVIIRLMLLVLLIWPAVITICGFYCYHILFSFAFNGLFITFAIQSYDVIFITDSYVFIL